MMQSSFLMQRKKIHKCIKFPDKEFLLPFFHLKKVVVVDIIFYVNGDKFGSCGFEEQIVQQI